jgi:small subunit ribosomal protein S1
MIDHAKLSAYKNFNIDLKKINKFFKINPMREILEKDFIKAPKIGEIIEGKIIGFGRSAVYLDLGFFGTGIIYGKEFFEAKNYLKKLKIGDKILTKIVDLENEEGYIELSVVQATKDLAWQQLIKKKEEGEILKVKILNANKGGLLSEVLGIQAFLPVSQLSSEHYPRVEGDQEKILKELKKFVGQELEVKILDLSPKEGKLILSERAKEAEKIKEILKNYKVGDIVEGEITAILDFGAFLRFGKENLEGLIHISEINPKTDKDSLKVGEKVKAKIIKINNDKVFLSLKK